MGKNYPTIIQQRPEMAAAHQIMRLEICRPSMLNAFGVSPIVNKNFIFLGEDTLKLGNPKTKSRDATYVSFKIRGLNEYHAEISLDKKKFRIKDTGSRLGTYINGTRLSKESEGSEWHLLVDGDEITLGYSQKSMLSLCNHVSMRFRQFDLDIDPTRRFREKPLLSDAVREVGGISFPECSICLEDINYRQALMVPSCLHVLHYDCARKLFKKSPNLFCPICRSLTHLEIVSILTQKQAQDILCSGVL
ncbi:hypothetical protein CLU79DRAFT_759384 [Phycomyces nitens]|nr:hypothetical protein CLU79DRAFT_759384 [Phycomyces nitens]